MKRLLTVLAAGGMVWTAAALAQNTAKKPDPAAVDRAANGMVSLGTPGLIRVERQRDHHSVARTAGNDRAETLRAHEPIVARRPVRESGLPP